MVVAFVPTAPGALAEPTPTPFVDANGVRLLVPPGKNLDTDEQLETAGGQLLRDPMGQRLVTARTRFGVSPGNVSVEWFDFSWLRNNKDFPWFRVDKFHAAMLETFKMSQGDFDVKGNYSIEARSITHAGNEELYAQLGADQASSLLEVATSNVFHGTHSEQIPLARIRAMAPAVIRRMNKDISDAEAKQLTETVLAKSSRGLASENSPCLNTCDKATRNFQQRFAISRYGRGGTPESDASVATSKNVMSKATARRSRERSEKSERERAAAVGLRPPCETGAAGQPGGGQHGGPIMAMAAARPLAAPCSSERGPSSSGLAEALGGKDYGGVDFSTVKLRYLSDDPDSGGVRYSFSGQPAAHGTRQDLDSGLDVLTNSLLDLRTWLVLNPNKFWVNLNPDEPDRIVDSDLGQTNAGRALLDADFRMKRDAGRLVDPNTPFGARYWKELGVSSGSVCYSSRLWIVPGDVEVRQDGSSLYVLKAKLNVKTQAMKISAVGNTPCNTDPKATARNERFEQATVAPKIAELVNSSPAYAPIRQAFLARVVAQWVRDRHRDGHTTSFDRLIDSHDLGPAKLGGSWRPRSVYDSFLRSIRNGDFTYRQTARVGNSTVTYVMRTGGVDFSKLSTRKLSAARMDKLYPGFAHAARSSTDHPASTSDGSVWLGESAGSQPVGVWSTISTYVGGRTGLLVVLLAALGIVVFLLRDGSALRRKKAG
ncbi:hypothetical protein ACFC0M_00055 [Streptomyces sp. NPDC056149]|uniref:hypothetical protein n=1 Tax=Streptomyces sp. NPDC056149 TaxID=3345728 RepID=UPI0035D6101D